ncbi:MAG: hypothetical protein GY804_10785 [Alphaproteobacteria bacterium]|nr:hypothetical protein [Alphaproteobacteria bacterium]
MIENIIQKLKDDNAVTFNKVSEKEIDFTNSFLTSNKFANIPEEYAIILRETDGLCWNGIEFYGTSPQLREAHDYTLPSLVDINSSFIRKEILENRLILGAAAEEVFVYDGRFKQFQIVRKFKFDIEEIYPTLYETLEAFI